MKHVLIGEASGADMDDVMAVYPRHKALVDTYVERGEVIGIGPFEEGGNMAVFRSRDAAETFAAQDPFVLEGIVTSYSIRAWHDQMLT